jgi:hypothetical protein
MSRYVPHTYYTNATFAGGLTNSSSIRCGRYNEATVYIRVADSPTGTNPTMDIDVETSPDNSQWYKDSDVPQITALGNAAIHKVTGNIGEYLRVGVTIGGTATPQFTGVDIKIVFKET